MAFPFKIKTFKEDTPPPILVLTWIQLNSSDLELEVIVHAKRMINLNFGSVDLAVIYLEQCQIKKVPLSVNKLVDQRST